MKFGETEASFTDSEIGVAVDAFCEAINRRLRVGNDPLEWQVGTLGILRYVKTRRNHTLDPRDGTVSESKVLKGIFGVIEEYVDNTSQSVARALKTQPANSILPLQRYEQGELAKRMIKEYEEARIAPAPVLDADALAARLSRDLVIATGEDFA